MKQSAPISYLQNVQILVDIISEIDLLDDIPEVITNCTDTSIRSIIRRKSTDMYSLHPLIVFVLDQMINSWFTWSIVPSRQLALHQHPGRWASPGGPLSSTSHGQRLEGRTEKCGSHPQSTPWKTSVIREEISDKFYKSQIMWIRFSLPLTVN